MRLLAEIGSVLAGVVLGALAGWAIGRRWESQRRTLWTAASAAFVVAMAADFAGFLVARPELSLAAVGLMGGIASGVKYAAFPQVRVWEAHAEEGRGESAEDSE